MAVSMISLVCTNCGKPFERSKRLYNQSIKRIKHFYCSRSCCAPNFGPKKEPTTVTTNCFFCGKEFEQKLNKYNYNRKVGRNNVCSKTCRTNYLIKNSQERGKKGLIQGRPPKPYQEFRPYIWGCLTSANTRRKKLRVRDLGNVGITEKFLSELWNKQSGRCALSGVPLKMHIRGVVKDLYTASVDRINNNIGYEPDNVQFVCLGANFAKNKFTNDEILDFFGILVDNYKKSV